MSDFKLFALLFAAPLILFVFVQLIVYIFTKVLEKHKLLAVVSMIANILLIYFVGREIARYAMYFRPKLVTTTDVWVGSLWVPIYPLAFLVAIVFTVVITYSMLSYAKQP